MSSELTLLEELAVLYDTQAKSFTIVTAARINSGLIEFSNRAVDNWNSILSEAQKQGKLEALVEVACRQYENERESLLALLQIWISPPDIVDAIPPQPKKYATPDPDVLIARELHWDRNSVATTFLGMMKRQEKYPYQVMGLEASKDADLDSLIDRFEEVCHQVQKPKPLLYAKILLSPALATAPRVAVEVLDNLRTAARKSSEEIVKGQVARFDLALDEIDRSSSGSAAQILSEHQLARRLKDCLDDVTQHSTVVLLLPRFHELRDQSSAWLRDTWLVSHACQIDGLVTVIAGERGLKSLRDLGQKGIYFPDQLPSMTWEDFFSWAQEGFGFDWFTERMAQDLHDECRGNPRKFAEFLKLTKIMGGVNRA